MCSIHTVIYKDFHLILISNYIYIGKYILYHYTLVVQNAETYCIWFKIFGCGQVERCWLNGRNLSWNSIDVARTIIDLSPRDFLRMTEAIFDEPEQSRKIVNICRERNFEVTIEDSCIGCGLCVNACTMNAISLESLQAHADSIQCCGCELCREDCPTNSIKILEIEYD